MPALDIVERTDLGHPIPAPFFVEWTPRLDDDEGIQRVLCQAYEDQERPFSNGCLDDRSALADASMGDSADESLAS